MSISSAQMLQQIASAEGPSVPSRSTPTAGPAASPASGAVPAPAAESAAPFATPTPAVSPPAQFSTDMQIDNHHQVYYEIVDDRSGDVLFEIPAEALRKIGESLNVPLLGDAQAPSLDVQS